MLASNEVRKDLLMTYTLLLMIKIIVVYRRVDIIV